MVHDPQRVEAIRKTAGTHLTKVLQLEGKVTNPDALKLVRHWLEDIEAFFLASLSREARTPQQESYWLGQAEAFLAVTIEQMKAFGFTPKVGPPPEPINSARLDPNKHWSILDQTKAEFQASGRSGVVVIVEPDEAYRAKLAAFLVKFQTSIDQLDPKKPYFVMEHETQATELHKAVLAAGLKGELFLAGNLQ